MPPTDIRAFERQAQETLTAGAGARPYQPSLYFKGLGPEDSDHHWFEKAGENINTMAFCLSLLRRTLWGQRDRSDAFYRRGCDGWATEDSYEITSPHYSVFRVATLAIMCECCVRLGWVDTVGKLQAQLDRAMAFAAVCALPFSSGTMTEKQQHYREAANRIECNLPPKFPTGVLGFVVALGGARSSRFMGASGWMFMDSQAIGAMLASECMEAPAKGDKFGRALKAGGYNWRYASQPVRNLIRRALLSNDVAALQDLWTLAVPLLSKSLTFVVTRSTGGLWWRTPTNPGSQGNMKGPHAAVIVYKPEPGKSWCRTIFLTGAGNAEWSAFDTEEIGGRITATWPAERRALEAPIPGGEVLCRFTFDKGAASMWPERVVPPVIPPPVPPPIKKQSWWQKFLDWIGL